MVSRELCEQFLLKQQAHYIWDDNLYQRNWNTEWYIRTERLLYVQYIKVLLRVVGGFGCR
jgi:hypothetical protein